MLRTRFSFSIAMPAPPITVRNRGETAEEEESEGEKGSVQGRDATRGGGGASVIQSLHVPCQEKAGARGGGGWPW